MMFLLWTASAWGAVAFDAGTPSAGDGSSFTFDHTTGAGTNLAVFACVAVEVFGDVPPTISAISYNSIPLGELGCVLHYGGANGRTCAYGLANSQVTASNTAAFAATFSGTTDAWSAGIESFTGVDQTTPFDAAMTDGADNVTLSTSIEVSSAVDDMVASCLGIQDTSIAVTNGDGQTQRIDIATRPILRATTEAGAATVTHSYDWSDVGYESYGYIVVNMNVAGGAPPPRHRVVSVIIE